MCEELIPVTKAVHEAITHEVLILAQRSEIHGASYKIAKLYAGCHFGDEVEQIALIQDDSPFLPF